MKKHLIYAAVALLAVVLAVVAVQWQPPADKLAGEKLFPDMENLELLNDIERVTVSRAGQAQFTVFRDEKKLWRLQQKGNYPAATKTIQKLLRSVASAAKLERKTDNPDYYARLGVGDEQGRLLVLYSPAKEWQLIVGASAQGNKSGQYVRIKDEKDSWLINQQLFIPDHFHNWLNRRIIHVEPRHVSQLTLKNPKYERPLVLVRSAPDKNLNYEGAPQDKEKMTMGLEFSARQLTAVTDYLNFNDIIERTELQDSLSDQAITADYETFGGLLLNIRAFAKGDQTHYAILDVGINKKSTVTDHVKKQVQELQPRFQRWAYQIPRYIYEDLDKDKEHFPGYDFGQEYHSKENDKSAQD